jgi:hypothetical protein
MWERIETEYDGDGRVVGSYSGMIAKETLDVDDQVIETIKKAYFGVVVRIAGGEVKFLRWCYDRAEGGGFMQLEYRLLDK